MAKNVWDGLGNRIGSVAELPDGKKHVYNGNGHPLGSVGGHGTVTTKGTLVSRTKLPGLLFSRTPKQRK